MTGVGLSDNLPPLTQDRREELTQPIPRKSIPIPNPKTLESPSQANCAKTSFGPPIPQANPAHHSAVKERNHGPNKRQPLISPRIHAPLARQPPQPNFSFLTTAKARLRAWGPSQQPARPGIRHRQKREFCRFSLVFPVFNELLLTFSLFRIDSERGRDYK